MSIGWAAAQNRTVKGTVISSEDNLSVIGANVVVVGQETIGTITEVDGSFELSVPANAKQLRISFSGLTPQVVDIKPVMRIVLSRSIEELDPVVVIGYGSGQTLSTVSGKVTRIGADKLKERQTANVMDALQGQVAGMAVSSASGDPTRLADVKIHGAGSLGAGTSPLYIVDGVQADARVVQSLSQNDIESYNVLTDASSTAIYGARAANGVIYITTKRGRTNESSRIVANAQFGISQLISRGNARDMLTGTELLDYQAPHLFGNASATGKDLYDYLKKGGYAVGAYGEDYDWMNYFVGKNAPTLSADVQMSGGSDRTSYFLSAGYFSQEGISRETSGIQRTTARVNLDSRVKDWFRVGVNINGAYTKMNQTSFENNPYYNSGTFGGTVLPPYYSPLDEDGNLRPYDNFKSLMGTFTLADKRNDYSPQTVNSYYLTGSAYAQLTPLRGLTLKTLLGLDFNIDRWTTLKMPSMPNSDGLGYRQEQYNDSKQFTWTSTAEYKFAIADRHDITLLLGHEWIDYDYSYFLTTSRGLESDDMMLLGQGQLGTFLSRPSSGSNAYAYNSFFGRANYSLDRIWFLDASVRNDASSRFGANTRSAWFYSVGTMLDFHRWLMPENETLSSLKFKASWGTLGNSEIGNYGHLALIGSTNYRPTLGTLVSQLGNPDLSWETQSKLNVGAIVGFANDRVTLDASFYMRDTRDMLMSVPLAYTTGFSSQMQNVGSLRNMGVDLTLEAAIVRTKDWNFDFRTTFNYNRQSVLSLFNDLDRYIIPGTGIAFVVGQPILHYTASFAGVDPETGKQMWHTLDANGEFSSETTTEYSSTLEAPYKGHLRYAPINGGFSLNVDWKKTGISLSADFSYSVGRSIVNNDRYFTEGNSAASLVLNKSRKILTEWRQRGDITDIPKYGEAMAFDSRLIEDASYMRLKNLQLSYQMPASIFSERSIITGVKVYVSARNLLTFTGFSGMDPESGSNLTMNAYPNSRQYMAGVQLMF